MQTTEAEQKQLLDKKKKIYRQLMVMQARGKTEKTANPKQTNPEKAARNP